MEPLSALRSAASALLDTARMPVVVAVLRALLDDAPVVGVMQGSPRARPPAPPRPRPNSPQRPDTSWDGRRKELRQAMVDRGTSYQELADQFGVARRTLQHALGRREPPTQAMRQRLEAWMTAAPAPEVAAPAPFHDRRGLASGNGSGRFDGEAA